MRLTPELSELIGMHVGDGSLYKTNRGLVWELRGDLKEKRHYKNYIVPLINNIFGINVKSKFRSGGKNGVWGIQTCNKIIIETLIHYGFNPGTKTYTVKVPDYIFNSSLEIKRAFVRGLFDTDGCLNLMKINNRKEKDYPRILFSSASKDLRDSVKDLLSQMKFESYIWNYKNNYNKNEYRLCLSGKEKLLRWERNIKPKNPKFLKKISEWKNKTKYFYAGIA